MGADLLQRYREIVDELTADLHLSAPDNALEESLSIQTRLHPKSWKTFEVQSDLGEALLMLGRLDESVPLLQEGYEGLNQNAETIPLSIRKDKLKKAVLRLRKLAESQVQPAEVKKWQQELDSLNDTKD